MDEVKRRVKYTLSFDTYRTYREAIDTENTFTLTIMTFIFSIVGGVLLAVSLLFPKTLPMTLAYLILFVVNFGVWIVCYKFYEHIKRFSIYILYVYLLACISASAILGLQQPSYNTVTFIVVLVITPLFIIDHPFRMNLILLVIVIGFAYATGKYKYPYIAQMDTINIISFYIISFFTTYQSVSAKISNIIANSKLLKKSSKDSLTDLYNRGALEDMVSQYIVENSNNQTINAALVILDIDNFKNVNDRYGHLVGDQVLDDVSTILTDTFKETDVVCRFGGDEFVVFVPNLTNNDNMISNIESIIKKAHNINTVEGLSISTTIGLVYYPSDGTTFNELYKNADKALYLAKQSGKNGYSIFHSGID